MEEGRAGDDKVMFDFYFVETMKALGLESELIEDEDLEDYYNEYRFNKRQENLDENDAILDEVIREATKPDEKEIKAAAAKLMKDPKFKVQYKGKKGVDFVKHAMAVAKKSMKKGKE